MNTISYRVVDPSGGVFVGQVDSNSSIAMTGQQQLSLHLKPENISGYARQGNDLLVTMATGDTLTLSNFYDMGGFPKQLFVSSNGQIQAVILEDDDDNGALEAGYSHLEASGKQTAFDDLLFYEDNVAVASATYGPDYMSYLPYILGAGAVAAGIAALASDDDNDNDGDDEVLVPEENLEITIDPTGRDDLILNNAEVTEDGGILITGVTEPGASVTVELLGETITTTADADGKYSVTFDRSVLPADMQDNDGGLPGPTATATATTSDGRTATTTHRVDLDLMTTVTIDEPVAGDGVISDTERDNGFTLTGTGEPGANVVVNVAGTELPVTVGDDGTWSVDVPPSAIPADGEGVPISASAVDEVGNTADASAINVPFEGFEPIEITIDPTGRADAILNNAEVTEDGGILITGMTEPGASVTVELLGETITTTADADGKYSVTFDRSVLPADMQDNDGGLPGPTATATATTSDGRTATTTHRVDLDLMTTVTIDEPVAGDGVISDTERDNGFTLTGTGEPGANVVVNVAGTELPVTVGDDGTWSVDVPPSAIPAGVDNVVISASSVDAVGNTANAPAISVPVYDPIEITIDPTGRADAILNNAEVTEDGGILITGMTEPGASVTVELLGETITTTADADGKYSVTFDRSILPADMQDNDGAIPGPVATASASTADGRTATATHQVDLDLMTGVDITEPVAGDGIINAAEAGSGFALTGTSEPGTTDVTVNFGGTELTATVQPDGSWSVDVPASAIPANGETVDITVTSVDHVNNTATSETVSVPVDTVVDNLAASCPPVEDANGDHVINQAEAANGLTLVGTTEVGTQSLTVTMTDSNGVANNYTASIAADGSWSVNVPRTDLADNTSYSISISATDAAGNTATISEQDCFSTDLVAPEYAFVKAVTYSNDGDTQALTIIDAEGTVSTSEVEANGTVSDAPAQLIDLGSQDLISFVSSGTVIPDGSDVLVNVEDGAGNTSTNYIAVDDSNDRSVDLSNPELSDFNIDSVDLSFASEASLTLTPELVAGLSDNSDTLIISGNTTPVGADDTVTAIGAVDTGEDVTVDGQNYSVYQFDNTTLVVDDEIEMITSTP